ncbi:MAG: hypothetical protein E4H27_07125 [Anaerolineales bacterium]|nr:MAG: hypothetical protein E4H27_07125 [Anaerolineales bacterium]
MVNRITRLYKLAAARVVAQPRPWVLRYLLSFIPAALFATAVTLPLWQSLPYSVIHNLTEQRDLEILLDTLIHIQDSDINLLFPLLAAFVACLVWLPVQLAAIWLEGGTLYSYTSEKPVLWKSFLQACNRWFGFMLLSQSLGTLITGIILIVTAGMSVAVRAILSPLMWFVLGCGLILTVLLDFWFETARAIAVTRNDKHLGHALHHSARLFIQEPITLPAFGVSAVAGMAALLLLQRWINAAIPGSWWLLSLIVSQLIQFTRHGMRLLRRGGEVISVKIYTAG